MFLDYDGTLSPIVEDPDRAVMSEEVSNFFIFSPSRRRRRFLFLLLSSSGIKAEYPQFPPTCFNRAESNDPAALAVIYSFRFFTSDERCRASCRGALPHRDRQREMQGQGTLFRFQPSVPLFFPIGIGNGTCSVSPFHSHCEKKVLFSCGGASSVLPCCTPTPTRLRPHCKKNLPGFLFYRFPSRFHLTRRARMHGVTPVNLDAPGPGQCMGAAGVSWLPSEPGAGRRGRNRHAENVERP